MDGECNKARRKAVRKLDPGDTEAPVEAEENTEPLISRIEECQTALTEVRRAIRELIRRTEAMERYYKQRSVDPDPYYFYLPTTCLRGLRIDEENNESRLPNPERSVRGRVAEFVVLLRHAVDAALLVVSRVATHTDSPFVDMEERWSHRLSEVLRQVRGSVLLGFEGRDQFPSALVVPGSGVVESLEDLYRRLGGFIENLGRGRSLGSDLPTFETMYRDRLWDENKHLKEEVDELRRADARKALTPENQLRRMRITLLHCEGRNQHEIAAEYSRRFKTPISQATVSRELKKARDADRLKSSNTGTGRHRTRTVDPGRLDLGPRHAKSDNR